ncbi:hypothetical protein [Methylobacterium gnaphalii]|nr:hypothetical protein [Methylobacterium gnaphalii]
MIDQLAMFGALFEDFEDDECEDDGEAEDDARRDERVAADASIDRCELREIRSVATVALLGLKAGVLPEPAPLPVTFTEGALEAA